MKRKLLKTGISIAVIRAINVLLGFTMTIVLSRTLGSTGLGVYAYATILITLITVPVSYGWGTLLLKATSSSQHNSDWHETKGMAIRGIQISVLTTGIMMTLSLIFIAIAPASYLPNYISPLTLAMLLTIILFDQLSALRAAMLRGMNSHIIAQIPEMVSRPAIFIIVFLCLLWGFKEQITVIHAFIALLTASFINLVLGSIFIQWKMPINLIRTSPSYSDRAWLIRAIPLTLSSGLIILNTTIDILVLGLFTDAADVGMYRVAVQVALFSGFAYTSLNMLATPRFAYFSAAKDKNGMQATATFLARLAFLGSLPIPIILLFSGDWIIPLIFGAPFSLALKPMIILSLGQCFSSMAGMSSSLLVMNGMEKIVAYLTVFSLILNLVLCLIFIPLYGIIGAASATALATGLWNIALWITVNRLLQIDSSIFRFLQSPKIKSIQK